MRKLVEAIVEKDLLTAKEIFEAEIATIAAIKLEEAKKIVAAYDNEINEETIDEARIKIVRARIRGGKLQRRKKVSNVPGYTFRGGKMTRMSPQERRKRRMGQRRGKIKRKAKLQRALMKRKRSMRRRAAMGI
jgi:hypothetical protein